MVGFAPRSTHTEQLEPAPPGAILQPGWLEARCRQRRADPEGLRRFRNALLKRGLSWEDARALLPPSLLSSQTSSNPDASLASALRPEYRRRSQRDGAEKWSLRTADGQAIETVIMEIQSGRTTVCVSSQVGCAVRCRFCATGRSEAVRGLSGPEILSQVVFARQRLRERGRRLRNVVFMGMGEPLLNEHALHEALTALLSAQHFHLSPRHVLVSTVGIPHKMLALARAFPEVGIALSLHSAQAEVRGELIPLGHRYDLQALHEAVRACNAVQDRPVMLEYLLLDRVNDGPAAIEALLGFCRGLDVRVNLIPYNNVAFSPDRPTPPKRQDEIARQLKDAGLAVTVRRSLGQDIAAACGQLVALRGRAPSL